MERLGVKASPIDMRELTWWFVVPELHDEVRWAEYQPTGVGTEWRLTRSTIMRTARPAVIHDRDCVEIEVDEESYSVDGLLAPPPAGRHTKVWGRLAETEVEWVAVEQAPTDGAHRLDTFLDDGFEQDWGACARRIDAGEWLAPIADGSFNRQPGTPAVFADGVYTVQVGERTFTCTQCRRDGEGSYRTGRDRPGVCGCERADRPLPPLRRQSTWPCGPAGHPFAHCYTVAPLQSDRA